MALIKRVIRIAMFLLFDCLSNINFLTGISEEWLGLGSCHSFGVAVGLRGYGMCQMRGQFGCRLFLKMRRVGHFFSHVSTVSFFQSPSCHEAVHLSLWEIFVSRVSPVR